ncbi:FAD-dependent monooxygenase [Actinomycetospora endophytica]|uniref:FAD-dependent monooxygenase n=1 Tax=Actinomycetospora endophytica TaxID=2291215 RepID=A0ABS8P463_9PSEU|nr:FAD-dependent monooxygenase [Actinomycetospora endophytica]MCD2192742.1 FAD-dependent monooxygenase [Actinomycetospora endophytica]
MEQVPLLVLGSGIDGLAAALCLAHQGFPVELLERGPDPQALDDAGPTGSMVVRPSAVRVLHGLGLLDALRPLALEVQRYTHLDAASGQPLRKVELGDVARARFGYPCLIVARRDMRRVLAEACAGDEMIGVHFESRPTEVEDIGDAALVTLEGGVQWRAEALVGADGASSRVRGLLESGAGALSPTFVVRRTTVAASAGEPASPELRVWSGPQLQAMRLPSPHGGAEVVLVMRADLPPAEREWVVSRLEPELRRAVSTVVAREPEQVLAHQRPLSRWTRNRLTVLGAAAQPFLPHAGEEENQTLLDAHALGAAFDRSDGRILPGLEGYETLRAPARAACAARVAEFAALSHAEGLTRRLRDRLWAREAVDEVAEVLGEL